ncbi:MULTISPECIES: hypothetical protein [unclassified Curtobacterium]|nr:MULTISPECIES: hypothetical protein [unclassified Curtobacterium]
MNGATKTEQNDNATIDIEDIVITDEDLMDVQLRNRMDVGH